MRLITDVLRDVRAGGLVTEASEQLQALVAKCLETNKPGTLTIKLTIEPKGGAINVADDLQVKAPKPPTGTIFFATDEHDLTRNNPHQGHLDLHHVQADDGTLLEIDPDTGEVLNHG